ncbi:MAG: hypothetical protein ACRDA3_00115 [Peptostreptococcaceae bacterium]
MENINDKAILEKINEINKYSELKPNVNDLTRDELIDIIVKYNELSTMEYKYISLLKSALDEERNR